MANQYRSVLAGGSAGTGGDAVAANVLAGKTFTNDNGFDTGTMVNNGAVSQTINAGQSYTIPEGYHNGNGTVTASQPVLPPINSAYIYVKSSEANKGFIILGGYTKVTPTSLEGDANNYSMLAPDGTVLHSTITVNTEYDVTGYNYVKINNAVNSAFSTEWDIE